jgi:hypothetical protein
LNAAPDPPVHCQLSTVAHPTILYTPSVPRFTPAHLLTCSLAAIALSACAFRPGQSLDSPGGPETDTPYPFAPASIEIHPLTRLTQDTSQRPLIICHVECRDAWGDTSKAFGALRVLLYRGTPGDPLGVQELRWDVDLTDLDRNAALFDPATRTYRLPLQDVPEWAGIGSAPGGRLRLRAVLDTVDARGRPTSIEDEFVLP